MYEWWSCESITTRKQFYPAFTNSSILKDINLTSSESNYHASDLKRYFMLQLMKSKQA